MKVHRRLSTAIGGGVGAVDDFLDHAEPHEHFSMDYGTGTYLRHLRKSPPEVHAHSPFSLISTIIVSTQSAKWAAHAARPAHAPPLQAALTP